MFEKIANAPYKHKAIYQTIFFNLYHSLCFIYLSIFLIQKHN